MAKMSKDKLSTGKAGAKEGGMKGKGTGPKKGGKASKGSGNATGLQESKKFPKHGLKG